MKVFIPSYGRAANIKTHFLWKGYDNKELFIVLHNQEEKIWYAKNKSLENENILVSYADVGIAKQRNWIIENKVSLDEWFVFMDDNINQILTVHKNFYDKTSIPTWIFNRKFWETVYDLQTDWPTFLQNCEKMASEADSRGAKFVGVATNDNPFYKKTKWRDVGFVRTKISLVKKTHLRFDENLIAKDDYGFTAENLKVFGRVLINNFIYPLAKSYEEGGIGLKKYRQNASALDVLRLIKNYPGLFVVSNRKNSRSGTELKIHFTTLSQIENWKKCF